MNKEITILQSLDTANIAKANFYILVTSKLKYYYIILIFAILINLILPYVAFNSSGNNEFDYGSLVFLAIVLVFPFLIWSFFKKSAKKVIQDKKRFFTNVFFKFSETDLNIEGQGFKNIYKWGESKKNFGDESMVFNICK